MDDKKGPAPLAGIRVIDITQVVMGPLATQILADLGADVIKVEPPDGDMLRGTGPGGRQGAGPLYLNLNRNKRSLVLDLKQPSGREAVLHLAETADVVVYNVRPEAMVRLGLSYEAFSEVNNKIIYVGTFGFSQRGRYAAARAFDDMIQAAVAIPDAAMRAGSDIPRYAPVNMADRVTGIYAFGIISAALLARERTGCGQAIDVPMFETMAQFVLGDHLYGHTFIPARADFGYPRILNPERRPLQTADGYACCLVYTESQWRKFLEAVGKGDLFDTDPRFKDGETRTKHSQELYSLIGEVLKTRTTERWQALLDPLGIPVFPMHTFDSLLSDPHLADIGFFQSVEHQTEGHLRTTATPSEWHGVQLPAYKSPPLLGEHSEEVLLEAGFSNEEIDRMLAAGVTRKAEGKKSD